MDLLELLQPEHVVVPLEAPDLRAAISTLVDRLEQAGAVEPSDALRERIAAQPLREAVAVTETAVLPHYRSEHVDALVVGLGVSPEPLPCHERGCGLAPRIVAVILAPREAATLYLQTASTLARLFREPGVTDALLAQPDAEALRALPQLQDVRIQPSLTVRDVMTHRIHAVEPDATVRRALDLMLRRRLNAVPVVGEKGEVVGLVSESDIMRALLPKIPRTGDDEPETDHEPGDQPVRDIMARSVLCVSDDLGISEVASMMINKDVEQIPVVHEGAITGMVSRADIIRKLFGHA
jgi:CBS domain-containing protein/mannitol/fructose-specific phosphotransferase system IIA component (Ntr-type)